jgi:pimeloyl-ACP methyl ester carboxylesterase
LRASNRASRPIRSGDVELAAEDNGRGRAIVLVHGLTATRRYVVHGSHLLERSGYRVIAYDARGHGESDPASEPGAYRYAELVADLEAVLDDCDLEAAVLAGASMGAATTLAFALAHPRQVAALVQITPAYVGGAEQDPERLARYDQLAEGLERKGVEGFMRAYGEPPVADRFQRLVREAIRQRLERHRHPQAVAAALRVVPGSSPFDGLDKLEQLRMPALVVASRDEADPEHPYEVARAYAERIAGAELVSEEPGESPLAWRGTRLSRAIAAFLDREGLGP